jgi:uncharacterized protein (DUF1810 family)
MIEVFNLNRFIEAQANIYGIALEEIKGGCKSSHWMWYIFPQYKGLGYSAVSQKYAINSVEEAVSYFNHPILGSRLLEITAAFLSHENKSAYEILGDPDYLKMKSSMTLFNAIQSDTDIFNQVLHTFYSGAECLATLSQLKV